MFQHSAALEETAELDRLVSDVLAGSRPRPGGASQNLTNSSREEQRPEHVQINAKNLHPRAVTVGLDDMISVWIRQRSGHQ